MSRITKKLLKDEIDGLEMARGRKRPFVADRAKLSAMWDAQLAKDLYAMFPDVLVEDLWSHTRSDKFVCGDSRCVSLVPAGEPGTCSIYYPGCDPLRACAALWPDDGDACPVSWATLPPRLVEVHEYIAHWLGAQSAIDHLTPRGER